MPAENLFALFYIHPVRDAEKSEKEGREIFEDKEYVEIRVKGQKNSSFSRPVKESDKTDFTNAWNAFKNNQVDFNIGTPITMLPGVTPAIALELKAVAINTIEDMASINDAEIMNIRGGRMLHQRAKAYLTACEIKNPDTEKIEDDEPVDVEKLSKDPEVKPTPKRRRKNVA